MSTPVITTRQRRTRLIRRHHLARTGIDPAGVTRDLLALHSSDPATPFLSLAARLADASVEDCEDALYAARTVWRMHAMRRTLWIVHVIDAPVVQAAAANAVATVERTKLLKWLAAVRPEGDLDDWVADVEAAVVTALSDGRPRRTPELSTAVPALQTRLQMGSGRWVTETPLSSRLLFLMAMQGALVRGRPQSWRSSQYEWALPDVWFGDAVIPFEDSAEHARAALARRWLDRFGPATTADLKWWMGWTVRQTTAALGAIGAVEVATEDGPAWVSPDDLPGDDDPADDTPVVALLPGLDPTTMGWKDRAFYLGGHGPRLFDRNGNAGPAVWLDGAVVGGWAQRPDGEVVTHLLDDVGADARALVDAEAARLTDWLEGTVITPRFRTPLERELSA